MNIIDKALNNTTMYRVVLYALLAIVAVSFGLSVFGLLGYSWLSLSGSLAVMMTFGFIANRTLSIVFRSAPALETGITSILILFLILKPADSLAEYAVLAFAAVLAMAAKYIFAFGARHIFNPAAITLVILGLLGGNTIFWWVGSQYLLPIVLVAGLLVVRKLRRFDMVGTFVLAAFLSYIAVRGLSAETPELLLSAILSGPLVFFAAFMLTEPQTAPQTRRLRLGFASIVGALYGIPFELHPLYASPELALVVGNIFAFAVTHRRRIRLRLASKTERGNNTYEFSFTPDHAIPFRAGQYLEWTLPHAKPDSRGNRRYFTIASSPTEPDIKLVARIAPNASSSFKRALLNLSPGDTLWATQIAGDFVLPKHVPAKLVFIAGGIGITPFRSMVQQVVDTGEQRDIRLYYCADRADDFSYWQLFNRAMTQGVTTHYVLTGSEIPTDWKGKIGTLTADTIRSDMPDYRDRLFYISGPNAMVAHYVKLLRSIGVPRTHIKTDYFPGF